MMNDSIEHYINNLFTPYDGAKSVADLKQDLLTDLNERFAELTAQGHSTEEALRETLDSIGDIEETLGEMADLTHRLERQVLVNFSGQALGESDFAHVTLHGGKFEGSALQGADFSGADLTGSSFRSSDVRGARFDGANLTDCRFVTLDLREATFRGATLVRTEFNKSGLDGTVFTALRLVDVSFTMVDLRGVTFEGCVMDGCAFPCADLRGVSFRGQTLRNVSLGRAALEGVSFQGATLQNVSFSPPFALFKKYYKAIKTIDFNGASMDKLTYNALKGLGAELDGVAVA